MSFETVMDTIRQNNILDPSEIETATFPSEADIDKVVYYFDFDLLLDKTSEPPFRGSAKEAMFPINVLAEAGNLEQAKAVSIFVNYWPKSTFDPNYRRLVTHSPHSYTYGWNYEFRIRLSHMMKFSPNNGFQENTIFGFQVYRNAVGAELWDQIMDVISDKDNPFISVDFIRTLSRINQMMNL